MDVERAEFQSSSSITDIEQRVQKEAKQHVADEEVERVRNDRDNKSHSEEMEWLRSSQSERLASTSFEDELNKFDRLKDELTNVKVLDSKLAVEQEKKEDPPTLTKLQPSPSKRTVLSWRGYKKSLHC